MIIHGLAFWKFAKPGHERHLQVLPARKAWLLPVCQDLKPSTEN
jgi:hypothetical protein